MLFLFIFDKVTNGEGESFLLLLLLVCFALPVQLDQQRECITQCILMEDLFAARSVCVPASWTYIVE